MESDLLGLHLSVLDVNLISDEDDRNAFANPNDILVPLRYIPVRDTGSHVEHDNRALTLDVVAVAKTAVSLLASCVPHVEDDRTQISLKVHGIHFHTTSGCNFKRKKSAGAKEK